MEIAMVNDVIVPIEEAMISAHDRGIYFGDGVYEVIRYSHGKLFAMDGHMARFENSLREMDMLEKVDLDVVRERVSRAVKEAGIEEAAVYFHVTRGCATRNHDYDDQWEPSFLLLVREFHARKGEGKAITQPDLRWKRCDIKSLNLLANVMAKHAATKAGCYEAILVDEEKGLVTEATSSSVMIVRDGALWTAPLTANILPGITRTYLLEYAAEVGLDVREESYTVEQMMTADEVMITGTGSEVMGITHIDGQAIGDGTCGKFAKLFHEMLEKEMEGA